MVTYGVSDTPTGIFETSTGEEISRQQAEQQKRDAEAASAKAEADRRRERDRKRDRDRRREEERIAEAARQANLKALADAAAKAERDRLARETIAKAEADRLAREAQTIFDTEKFNEEQARIAETERRIKEQQAERDRIARETIFQTPTPTPVTHVPSAVVPVPTTPKIDLEKKWNEAIMGDTFVGTTKLRSEFGGVKYKYDRLIKDDKFIGTQTQYDNYIRESEALSQALSKEYNTYKKDVEDYNYELTHYGIFTTATGLAAAPTIIPPTPPPTAREEALQMSLPAGERDLPPMTLPPEPPTMKEKVIGKISEISTKIIDPISKVEVPFTDTKIVDIPFFETTIGEAASLPAKAIEGILDFSAAGWEDLYDKTYGTIELQPMTWKGQGTKPKRNTIEWKQAIVMGTLVPTITGEKVGKIIKTTGELATYVTPILGLTYIASSAAKGINTYSNPEKEADRRFEEYYKEYKADYDVAYKNLASGYELSDIKTKAQLRTEVMSEIITNVKSGAAIEAATSLAFLGGIGAVKTVGAGLKVVPRTSLGGLSKKEIAEAAKAATKEFKALESAPVKFFEVVEKDTGKIITKGFQEAKGLKTEFVIEGALKKIDGKVFLPKATGKGITTGEILVKGKPVQVISPSVFEVGAKGVSKPIGKIGDVEVFGQIGKTVTIPGASSIAFYKAPPKESIGLLTKPKEIKPEVITKQIEKNIFIGGKPSVDVAEQVAFKFGKEKYGTTRDPLGVEYKPELTLTKGKDTLGLTITKPKTPGFFEGEVVKVGEIPLKIKTPKPVVASVTFEIKPSLLITKTPLAKTFAGPKPKFPTPKQNIPGIYNVGGTKQFAGVTEPGFIPIHIPTKVPILPKPVIKAPTIKLTIPLKIKTPIPKVKTPITKPKFIPDYLPSMVGGTGLVLTKSLPSITPKIKFEETIVSGPLIIPKPATTTTFMEPQVTTKFLEPFAVTTGLTTSILDTKTEVDVIQVPKLTTTTIQVPLLKSKTDTMAIQAFKQSQVSAQALISRPVLKTREIGVSPRPRFRIPPFLIPSPAKKRKVRKKVRKVRPGTYTGYIKRFGKWKVHTTGAKIPVMAKTKRKIKRELGASYKIKGPQGKYVMIPITRQFRRSRAKKTPYVMVEKAKYRLNAPKEKSEIKYAKKIAPKKKKKVRRKKRKTNMFFK